MSNPDIFGPTVYEAACLEIDRLTREISELTEQRQAAMLRTQRYFDSKMLESERIATRAEPFQRMQLPDA